MGHEIKYLTAERIKCGCGWMFNLDSRKLWGSQKGNDTMLDAHSLHKTSIEQSLKREGP